MQSTLNTTYPVFVQYYSSVKTVTISVSCEVLFPWFRSIIDNCSGFPVLIANDKTEHF